MAEYKNISNVNQWIEEHRRSVGPGEIVDLNPEEVRLPSYSKGMAKGGWLLPILEGVLSQSIEQTLDNELDHVTHQPEQPFNIDIPIGGLVDKGLPINKILQEGIEREKQNRAEEIRQNVISKALGNGQDEMPYVPPYVGRGEYGNAELNNYGDHATVYTPPNINGEEVSYPSRDLDTMTEKMLANQLPQPQEIKVVKATVSKNKVKPKSKVVKKPIPKK